MPLSPPVIERLFSRLNATYGRDFMSRWEGLDPAAVKTSWGHELGSFEGRLNAITWALENLPERAPNVIEFRTLCRRAPAPEVPLLPEPQADPERVSAEVAKLAQVRQAASSQPVDHKAWARKIMQRHADGEKINLYPLRLAREALGLPLPAPRYLRRRGADHAAAQDVHEPEFA